MSSSYVEALLPCFYKNCFFLFLAIFPSPLIVLFLHAFEAAACASPCIPHTTVGICKLANEYFVKTCCRCDGFHFASQEMKTYDIIDSNKLREELRPLPKIKDNHSELKVMI